MSYLASVRGKGTLTVHGVLCVRRHPPVPASYKISVYTGPGGFKFVSGTMTAEPLALSAAANGGHPILQLETGEDIEIALSNVSGSQGQFYVKTRILSQLSGRNSRSSSLRR